MDNGECPTELQFLDEWQQSELMQGWQRVATCTAIAIWDKKFRPEYQGTVEVWGRDVAPDDTGRRARLEGLVVVCEVDDDHLHDFRWE